MRTIVIAAVILGLAVLSDQAVFARDQRERRTARESRAERATVRQHAGNWRDSAVRF